MRADCRLIHPDGGQPDNRPDVLVARLAATQWGVLSSADLRRCGLTHRAVESRVRNGHLHPLYRGVYAVGHASVPVEGRFLAAVKACGPTAVLSHFSAAALFELLRWDDRYPEVTVPGTATKAHRGIRVHRSSMLDSRDITRHCGIPTTTPARTLIDLAASFEYRALRRTVREAQTRLTNVPQIVNALDRLGPRRGTANLTKILATGPAPTRSELEDTVLDLILAGGFQHPEVNRPLSISAAASSPISGGRPSAWSSRPTAPNGTTTPSPARTTPSARPSSRRTASASSASRGSRRSPAGTRR
jgi:Transcriptional regulator, AbiEi antitoxin